MAERRMFAKTIVLSDAFLDLPMSARCLYFTLGMLADDDGFVNAPRSIMRQCGASDDDMKLLLAKKFALLFDSGVIVIKHWRINNYLRSDRYVPTKYGEEKAALDVESTGAYHLREAGEVPALDAREQAYKDSELPYSFEYKIRRAFDGRVCPVCGATMKYFKGAVHAPTIQHNLPISKGGKHELSNISVICKSCNVNIKDEPTGPLNNLDVIEVWNEINGGDGIPYDGIPNNGIPRIGKDRIGKDSIGQDRIGEKENLSSYLSDDDDFENPMIPGGLV